jgi:protein phosphatase
MASPLIAPDVQTAPDLKAEGPPVAHPVLTLKSHGRTDKGRVRPNNEDHFLIAELAKALQIRQSSLDQGEVQYSGPQGHLFLVADGVGGSAGGERASALAVNTVENYVLDTLNWCHSLKGNADDRVLNEFRKALRLADEKLCREADKMPELHGMGTTMTMAYCLDSELFVAHVGDSRCYLLRGGLLYRLTRDHTMVEEMVRRGLLKPEEAAVHGFRHVITNVVGGSSPGVNVEVHKIALEAGDRLLLCTDGLTEMVPEEEILQELVAEAEPEQACERLVARANENGGKDNVTVVVVHFAD